MNKLPAFILSCCCFLQASSQTNIVKAEYYVDSDPGFGNAVNIPVSASINIIDNTFPVALGAVSQGMHAVFIRSRNATGNWSLTNPLFFYKQTSTTALANVTKAEYYFDNDPGFGFGINIPLTAGTDIQNLSFTSNINLLVVGIHILFVRSLDANGKWGVTNQLVFYKKDAATAAPNITKAEYYFDNDPGFGYGTNIALTAAPDLQDISFVANINSLPVGIHILFVRSFDANGKWSVTNQLVYYKKSPTTAAPNITKAEYYFDNDPGFGYATNIPLTAGQDIQNLSFLANINFMPVGIHILFVRSFDANGKWSVTNQLVYYKKDPNTAAPNITKAEYYFDNDPGFGYGTTIPATGATDLQNINFIPNIQPLTIGLHILFLRSFDAYGKWSVTNQMVFYKPPAAPGGITAIEYYYDSEPGFGYGIPVAINPIMDLADYVIPVNITGLPTGNHNLFMRSRSSNGWSVTNIYSFAITTTSPTPFININSITSTTNCAKADFRITFHSTGNYLPNNFFTVQLSDSSGAFGSPINIGQVTAQISSEVSCHLPTHLIDGAGYRIRVISSNTAVTGVPSLSPVSIHDRPELGNDTTVFIVCANETLNLLPLYNTVGLLSNWSIATPTVAPAGNYQLIVTNIYGCMDSARAIVKQDVSTWTGAISNNWHTAGNWSTGRVPNDKTHIIIPSTAINPCEIISGDAVAASVQVKTGGVIKINSNLNLMVVANCNPLPTGL